MQCLFSGEETNSEEHVIPQWLQRRFKLQEQTVMIPNGTSLKYKHVKVPALASHNSKFGEIENRISNGIFVPSELYLWALKIHIGMIFRDGSLKTDIRNPAAPFILNIGDFASEVNFFQLLYKIWLTGGITDPSPLGSVFILDSLIDHDTFDFFHCLVTGTVGVHIGGKFIVVFLWDQGDGLLANLLDQWKYHVHTVTSMPPTKERKDRGYMAHHVWALESGYWLYRNRRKMNFIATENQLVLIPPLFRLPTRPPTETDYRVVGRSFGLELLVYNGETSNQYRPLLAGK